MEKVLKTWRNFLNEAKERPNDDVKEVSKVIIVKDGKFLALKRSADSEFGPNKWDLPGGHLKKGENGVEGAKREVKEETNLEIDDLQKKNTEKNVTFYKTSQFSGNIELDLAENSEFKWFDPKKLEDLDILPLMKQAIEQNMDLDEDYQTNIKKNHSKKKKKSIGLGGNTYNVAGKMQKPSYKRSKSAPPGAGGA